MSVLRKKPVAILIAALIVVLSTLIGARTSLSRTSGEVEELFYSGVEYDGYVHSSIASQLTKRAEAANGLLSVGRAHDLNSECTALAQAREELMAGGTISVQYLNDVALEKAFAVLQAALGKCALTERETAAVETYVSTFNNAAHVIGASGYNDAVRKAYSSTFGRFPANVLCSVTGVKAPQYFS